MAGGEFIPTCHVYGPSAGDYLQGILVRRGSSTRGLNGVLIYLQGEQDLCRNFHKLMGDSDGCDAAF